MSKSSTLFLKLVIILIGVLVLTGLIWFPQTEGRAAGLDLINIYKDPFLIYIYFASTPFFAGLRQAFKLLNIIDANRAFSQDAINTLKQMKLHSISLICFIALALLYLRLATNSDDFAGPTMIGIILVLAFGVIATAAGIFQNLLQNAVDIKSENDLTV